MYRSGEAFDVRDINTYVRLGNQHAKDKVAGYSMRAEIKGSDAATFAEIDGHYSKDAKHVFWSDFDSNKGAHPPVERSVTLAGADPATFAMLEKNHAADAGQVYYEGRVISKSPAAFRVLENDYAVSDENVFYRGEVLKGADVASFTVLPLTTEGATAQDKNGQFNYRKRVPK